MISSKDFIYNIDPSEFDHYLPKFEFLLANEDKNYIFNIDEMYWFLYLPSSKSVVTTEEQSIKTYIDGDSKAGIIVMGTIDIIDMRSILS
jgi:hypothetical protein